MLNNVIITVKPEKEMFNSTFEGERFVVSEKDLSTGISPFVQALNMKNGIQQLLYVAGSVKETFLLNSKLNIRPDRVSPIVCQNLPLTEEQKAMISNKEVTPDEVSRTYNLMTINPNADQWRKEVKFPFSTISTNTGNKLRPAILSGVFQVTKIIKGGKELEVRLSDLTIDSMMGIITHMEIQPIQSEEDSK